MQTDLTDQAGTVGRPKTCFTGVSPVAAYLTTTTAIRLSKCFENNFKMFTS